MIHCKVFAPDFNIIYENDLQHFDACISHTMLWQEDRITNKEKLLTLTEHIKAIEVTRGHGVIIWYESGAHIELTK